jgi:hypothetical protein
VARAIIVSAGVLLAGCSGGDGGLIPKGSVIGVSFVGYPLAPGVPPPAVFLNEAIEFRFDGTIDHGILGGFF